jgi:hypothetical protein
LSAPSGDQATAKTLCGCLRMCRSKGLIGKGVRKYGREGALQYTPQQQPFRPGTHSPHLYEFGHRGACGSKAFITDRHRDEEKRPLCKNAWPHFVGG